MRMKAQPTRSTRRRNRDQDLSKTDRNRLSDNMGRYSRAYRLVQPGRHPKQIPDKAWRAGWARRPPGVPHAPPLGRNMRVPGKVRNRAPCYPWSGSQGCGIDNTLFEIYSDCQTIISVRRDNEARDCTIMGELTDGSSSRLLRLAFNGHHPITINGLPGRSAMLAAPIHALRACRKCPSPLSESRSARRMNSFGSSILTH